MWVDGKDNGSWFLPNDFTKKQRKNLATAFIGGDPELQSSIKIHSDALDASRGRSTFNHGRS